MTDYFQSLKGLSLEAAGWSLIRHYDTAFHEGRFQEIADELDGLDPSWLGENLLVAVLCYSRWAKSELGDSRVRFIERAEPRLVAWIGPERTARILSRQR